MAYRFGPFLYDSVSHGLLKDGAEIPLTHKSRELLLLFLHNPGRLLTREEIVEKVWPDAAVTDDALRFQVAELRKAFGAKGAMFISTIRREGYRWEAAVRAAADRPLRVAEELGGRRPEPRYRLVLETREVQLLEGENVVGRDPDVALWIDHPSVSRRHARILVAGGKATLEDLESKNGTHLNGKKIERRSPLSDGDEVRIGPETMVFRSMSPETTRTERRA
ncbi:MAG: FHA domain-containing protein [Thermoanaerobaculia bacterium]